ncbi:MauE/DoxX family redox-associated membrane protein [Sandarakinorhabdus oryzae]|uniref:MauE/DoxX family redox-associated membrane protein n=1 Tax=Sandarakinorhabdus oryzae TaxID=2675220 RepID=UPI0012E1A920|nr:MauE/DoxX family redox-associated membrane protein [Sandarakinorhabdus oryzae]
MAPVLPLLGLTASVAVALLLAIAGIDKLRYRALLPGVIANYRLLPEVLVAPAAALLPVVELLVAVGLLAGIAPPPPLAAVILLAPLAAIALLLVFAGAMAINIGRGRRHIDCGCGHAGLRQSLGWGQVLRNVALAAALLPALLPGRAALGMADAAMAMAAGVALYLLLLMASALGALAASAPGRS